MKVLTDAIAGMKSQSGAEGESERAGDSLRAAGARVSRSRKITRLRFRRIEEMGKLGPESQKRAQMLLIDTYRESHDIDRAIAETKKALEADAERPRA